MNLEEDHIHWFNFPQLESKSHSLDLVLVKKLFNLLNKQTPMIIHTLNDSMTVLENIKHNDVEYLNSVGIDIYLYEPLVSYYIGEHNQHMNPQFYFEFAGNEDVDLIRAKELDSIHAYIINNNLTNVTVHTCDYDVEKYYPYYNNMKLITDDVFIKLYTLSRRPLPPPVNKIEKKFISLNWRYTTHRHIIAAYLKSTDSAFLSWRYKCNLETFRKNLWFDIDKWKNTKQYNNLLSGMSQLDIESPVTLDTREVAVDLNTDYQSYPLQQYAPEISVFLKKSTNDIISDIYTKAFIAVVNESRFAQPTGNFSEKVIQAMLHKLPFILVAPPNTLRYMREMGFKTFSEFWDESYDEITCNADRMLKILQLIDSINDKSMEELESIREKIQDIVKYNYTLVRVMSHNLYAT
jgi:hypothetical protein